MSDTSIEIVITIKDMVKFLNKYPPMIATAIIGVKFGGCGINLAKANNKIIQIGNVNSLNFLSNFIIELSYILFLNKSNIRLF